MADKPIDSKIIELDLDAVKFNASAAQVSKTFNTMSESDMKKMGSSLDTVSSKFTTLGIVGTEVLRNITNRLTDFAITSVTKQIDDLRHGFSQYEQEMKSTMMLQTNLGKDANAQIDAAIARLTDYANLTVYNVADMYDSLAQLSNQGIDLDAATVAIEGLGNVAASAGVDAARFASVMKTAQVQAMSMGYMSLENWRQMQDAGMATQKYKDTLLQVAYEMGKNVDLTNGFDMSLQQAWMSTEVMMEALQRLAKDESLIEASQKFVTFSQAMDAVVEGVATSWSKVFKELFGGVDESRELWTNIGNALIDFTQKPIENIGEIAKEFVKLGGMENIIDGVSSAFAGFNDILDAVGEGISKAFPEANVANTLYIISDAFKNLVNNIRPSEESLERLSNITMIVFDAFDSVWNILTFGFDILKQFAPILDPVIDILGIAVSSLKEFSEELFNIDIDITLGEAVNSVTNVLEQLTEGATNIKDVISNIPKTIVALKDSLVDFIGEVEIGEVVSTLAKIVAIGVVLKAIFNIFSSGTKVTATIRSLIDGFQDLQDGISDWLDSAKVLNFAVSIGILTAAMFAIASLDTSQLMNGLIGLSGAMAMLIVSFKVFESIEIKESSVKIMAFAASIGILTMAMKSLSDVDSNALFGGIVAMSTMSAVMFSLTKLLSSVTIPVEGLLSFIALSVSMAASLKILGVSIKDFENVEFDTVGKAIIMMGSLLATSFALTQIKMTDFSGLASLIAVVASLNLVLAPLEKLEKINFKEVVSGTAGMAIALTALGAASYGMGYFAKEIAIGAAVIAALGVSISLFGSGLGLSLGLIVDAFDKFMTTITRSISELSSLDFPTLTYGITALAGSLTALALTATALAPLSPAVMLTATALGALGLAITILGTGIGGSVSLITNSINSLVDLFIRLDTDIEILISGLENLESNSSVIFNNLALIFLNGVTIFAQFFDQVLNVVSEYGPSIAFKTGQIAVGLIQSFVAGVISESARNVSVIATSVGDMVDAVVTAVPALSSTMHGIGISIMTGLLRGISEGMDNVATYMGTFFDTKIANPLANKISGLADTLQGLDDILPGLGSSISKPLDSLTNSLNGLTAVDYSNIINPFGKIADGIDNMYNSSVNSKKLETNLKNTNNALLEMAEGINSASNATKEFSATDKLISDVSDSFKDLFSSADSSDFTKETVDNVNILTNTLNGLNGTTASTEEALKKMGLTAEEATSGITDAVTEDMYSYKQAMEEGLWGAAEDSLDTAKSSGGSVGSAVGEGMKEGLESELENGFYATLEEAMSAYENTLKAIEEGSNDYEGVGSSIETPYFGSGYGPQGSGGSGTAENPYQIGYTPWEQVVDKDGKVWWGQQDGTLSEGPKLEQISKPELQEYSDGGEAIIEAFKDGLSKPDLNSAISDQMTTVSEYFPHSPAKKGPFSGKGWTLFSGKALIEGFIEGMSSGDISGTENIFSALKSKMNSLQEDLSNGFTISPMLSPWLSMDNVPEVALAGMGGAQIDIPSMSHGGVQNNIQTHDNYEIVVTSTSADPAEVANEVEKRLLSSDKIADKTIARISKLEKLKGGVKK